MTERLYYTDAYATELDADVVSAIRHDGRPAAILNRTIFYPTSGGQPFDVGRLGDARVVDVVDDDDGTVVHVLDREIAPGPVHGAIDWPRRFDHMQQHTGQHVLSAAFARLFDVRTESFHLGSASSTIDLARVVSPEEIGRAEDEGNRVVWEDRPVGIRFADAGEAASLPLRKEPVRGGRLRLVDVDGFDLSACGGTHVSRTGGIGIIAIASWERFRGGSRVEFLCGVRALAGYRSLRDAVAAATRPLSVSAAELPAAVERLQADARDAKRAVKDLQSRVAIVEAAALAADAETRGSLRVVVRALDGWDANGLKTIASAIVERAGHVAILFGGPPSVPVVIMRSGDVTFDCAAALKRVTAAFGGKGGGRPDVAQGGGLQGAGDAIVAFGRSLFEAV